MHESRRPIIGFIPVAVIDCSYEAALIEQVADNIRGTMQGDYRPIARAVLTDLGIIRRRANR